MKNGWIVLHRKLKSWEWYGCPEMVALWVHLLLSANHDTQKWHGIEIKRGQLITGRYSLAEATGISEKSIRTCLERLRSTGEVAIQSTNRYSIITILHYNDYQDKPEATGQPAGQQGANSGPTVGQQGATNNNYNNYNNSTKDIIPALSSETPPIPVKPKPTFNPEGKTKYLDWVYLSPDQYRRVVKYYEEKGLDYADFKEAVRELDRWFGDNPKKRLKRTDDAKALMGWPLDRALQRRRELLNTQAAERRLKEQAA